MTTGTANSTDTLLERLRAATIGRYDIYAELGRGGMAAVFLALDLALDRKVAIKVMLPEIMSGVGTIDRFRREARLAASLSHPHIVPVYSVGDSAELAYFVMKFIDGRSLDSVVRAEGRQSPAFVQAILQQVGSALDHAHKRNVIHRDVKPANIMLDEGGWVMLTDFGIAKLEDDYALTSSGMIIGTPSYMSPEHFSGLGVGASADQYALGVVGYELLTGRPPFICNTVAELMKAHIMDVPTPVQDVVPRVPHSLSDCIMRMLAKTPQERFPSLSDAIATINQISPELQHAVSSQITALARINADQRPKISVPISPAPMRSAARLAQGATANDVIANTPADATTLQRSRGNFVRWATLSGAVVLIAAAASFMLLSQDQNPDDGPLNVSTVVPNQANPQVASLAPDTARPASASPATLSPPPPSRPKPEATRTDQRARNNPATTKSKDSMPAQPTTTVPASVAPLDSQKQAQVDPTPPVSPPSTASEPQRGSIRLGARVPDLMISINNGTWRPLLAGMRVFSVPAGEVNVRVAKEGCNNMINETHKVPVNDTIQRGYVVLDCKSPSTPPNS